MSGASVPPGPPSIVGCIPGVPPSTVGYDPRGSQPNLKSDFLAPDTGIYWLVLCKTSTAQLLALLPSPSFAPNLALPSSIFPRFSHPLPFLHSSSQTLFLYAFSNHSPSLQGDLGSGEKVQRLRHLLYMAVTHTRFKSWHHQCPLSTAGHDP